MKFLIFFHIYLISSHATSISRTGEEITFSLLNYTSSDEEVLEKGLLLAPNSEMKIIVSDFPAQLGFIVFQVHTHLYNLTVSYERTLEYHSYVNGTNVGLVYEIRDYSPPASYYIQNSNDHDVSTLLVVIPYSESSPVPGGCNMVLPIPVSPYLLLEQNNAMITIEGPPASYVGDDYICGISAFSYFVFYKYSPESDYSSDTYFDSIRSMLTYSRILNNSFLTNAPIEGSPLRRYFSKYSGTGTSYAMVVIDKFGHASVYTPTHTYGCADENNIDSCRIFSSPMVNVFIIIFTVISFFLCFAGHRYFSCEMFLMAFEVGFIIVFVLLLQQVSYSEDLVLMASAFSVVSGVIWVSAWWCTGSPLLVVFLPFLMCGFLCSSTLYFFTLGDMSIFQVDINFRMTILVMTILIALIFTTQPVKYNMFACALIGGYGAILPFDFFMGSNLKYIIINVIRRATVDNFNFANTKPPFQIRDFLLLIIWMILTLRGFKYQQFLSTNRPPFPPKCYLMRAQPAERSPLIPSSP